MTERTARTVQILCLYYLNKIVWQTVVYLKRNVFDESLRFLFSLRHTAVTSYCKTEAFLWKCHRVVFDNSILNQWRVVLLSLTYMVKLTKQDHDTTKFYFLVTFSFLFIHSVRSPSRKGANFREEMMQRTYWCLYFFWLPQIVAESQKRQIER